MIKMRKEEDIIKNWDKKSPIIVSIACVAYNHEDYISKTLDSFLMQETDFAFEILIHDDASTDKTADIIREYEKNYPNIIKPIYQSVNQFSQEINPMFFIFKKVKGKYMAFCDGDDHWIDNQKLKIQVEEMEKFSNIDMSFHPVYKLIDDKRDKILAKHSDKNRVFSLKEVLLGGGEFCPTASLMFRSRIILELPDWFSVIIPGDYPMQIMGSINSGALYINRCMSIYRVGGVGAWSSTLSKDNSEIQKRHLLSFHDMLNNMNKYLDNRIKSEIDELIYDSSLAFIKRRTVDIKVRDEVFRLYQETFSKKQKLMWYLLYRNSDLHNNLSKIKHMAFSR
jgi:glycosyltransferase involved in cell wall biosynthesis